MRRILQTPKFQTEGFNHWLYQRLECFCFYRHFSLLSLRTLQTKSGQTAHFKLSNKLPAFDSVYPSLITTRPSTQQNTSPNKKPLKRGFPKFLYRFTFSDIAIRDSSAGLEAAALFLNYSQENSDNTRGRNLTPNHFINTTVFGASAHEIRLLGLIQT